MQPKFIADGMNGDLARWLRILGYDCLYFNLEGERADLEIMRIAQEENRVILTADRLLLEKCKKKGIKVIFTKGKDIVEKLAIIIKEFNLPRELRHPPRCTICNSPLKEATADEVKDKIQYKGLLNRYSKFWICNSCGKIYWEGSHWRRIMETIRRSFKLADKISEI